MMFRASLPCLLLLAACSSASDGPDVQRVGMANPASVYCAKLGGTLEIRREQGGEAGYCRLRDGTTIEEWKLYRDTNPL